jgi:hypothetical protein
MVEKPRGFLATRGGIEYDAHSHAADMVFQRQGVEDKRSKPD